MKLSRDQADAFESIVQWLMTPDEPFMVLSGSPGTGKSYLINHVYDMAPKIAKILGLPMLSVYVTGATNKSLALLPTEAHPETIHRFMKLRVEYDYSAVPPKAKLIQKGIPNLLRNSLVIIDECSMIDGHVFDLICKQLKHTKVLFVGDKHQLPPVKSNYSPAFVAGFPQVDLTKNQRILLKDSALFDTVDKLKLGVEAQKILISFSEDPTLEVVNTEQDFVEKYRNTEGNKQILAYKNATVNNYCALLEHGSAVQDYEPDIGDSVYTVFFVRSYESVPIPTQSIFTVVGKHTMTVNLRPGEDVELTVVVTDTGLSIPILSRNRRKQLETKIKKDSLISQDKRGYLFKMLGESIAELRPLHSCTVHQSQGSTVDTVFVDYDDIVSGKSKATAARLLYVAVSRARKKAVILQRL